jgi:alpha-glutamyl/putrescinyl thymine pyrophosphorylase clade 1
MMEMDLTIVKHFIPEREAMRKKRGAGLPWPWTDDSILRDNRFCNVRREDDRTSQWFAKNWREPLADHPDGWFAAAVAAFVNLPETMNEIGLPLPYDRERIRGVLLSRQQRGLPMFGAAYKIRGVDTVDYVLHRLHRSRDIIRPAPGVSLQAFAERLMQFDGIAGFMAGQIIAGAKYAGALRSAPDWMTFAVSGPGSKKGLARVLGRPANFDWGRYEASWRTAFGRFESAMRPWLEEVGLDDLHCQDLQNCLCETDKYWRTLNGEGKPKRRYAPPSMPLAEAA